MKAKRLLLLTTIIFALTSATVYAGSLWGSYEGYQKVKVFVNDTELQGDVPAFIVNGTTVVPLRQTATALQSIIKWDEATQTANMYKPNVHMFIAKDIDSDYTIKKPFGKVAVGETMSFVVSTQVENLRTSVSGFRILIEDPSGTYVDSKEVSIEDPSIPSFWYTWPFNKVKFAAKGDYKVKFAFLTQDGYTVVSQKFITAE